MRHFRNWVTGFYVLVSFGLMVSLLVTFLGGEFGLGRGVLRVADDIWKVLFVVLILSIRFRVLDFRPGRMRGKFGGVKWVARMKYDGEGQANDVEITWLCPRHKEWLEVKVCDVEGGSEQEVLFCAKCGKGYELKLAHGSAEPREAEVAIRNGLMSEVDMR